MAKWPILKTWLIIPVIFAVLATGTTADGKTIYVDDDATGANNGSSWANAYNYLQDALMVASAPDEIWVAQGVYKPHQFVLSLRPNLGRMETFQLKNGVALKGGYAGLAEPDPNARDIDLYETILSGDLAGDDIDVNDLSELLDEPTRSENSYNVVTASGTDETAVLDGFTITGGNANDEHYYKQQSKGGGICNINANPILINCTFCKNSANWGGGMYIGFSNPILQNCTFNENSANQDGGGLLNSYSSPILTNCTFNNNSANWGGGMGNSIGCNPTMNNCIFNMNSAYNGGGMVNDYECSPKLTNCTFNNNSAEENGGGIYNHEDSNPNLNNCRFTGNSCGNGGGGMWISMSNPTLYNCIFTRNSAVFGGGITNFAESSLVLTNCTFSGNSATISGGVDNSWDSRAILTNCTFTGNRADFGVGGLYNFLSIARLTNCILWDGGDEILYSFGSIIVIRYSNVQGGFPGEGNIDVDPLFADPGFWDPNGTPEDPNDDFWIDGDYHLKSQAVRWDPASQSWIQDDVTSPCIDAGDMSSPIGFEPFPNGGIINMGAYGGTEEASKSYFDAPVCETVIAGDINGDCKVDFNDFAIMALHWLEER